MEQATQTQRRLVKLVNPENSVEGLIRGRDYVIIEPTEEKELITDYGPDFANTLLRFKNCIWYRKTKLENYHYKSREITSIIIWKDDSDVFKRQVYEIADKLMRGTDAE